MDEVIHQGFSLPLSRESCRPRSRAAVSARATTALSSPSSKTCSAAAVAPPGEVTCLRKAAGASPDSNAIRAAPKAVCNVSCRAASGGRPRPMPASSRSSISRKKYAGPLPERAVTASIRDSSSIHSAVPTASRSAWAVARCALLTRGLAQSAAAPAPSSAGVLGMARTIASPPPSQCSRSGAAMPAAMERTSGLRAWTAAATLSAAGFITCGFTANTTTSASCTAAAPSALIRTGIRLAMSARCSALGSETLMRPGLQPLATRPPTRLRAMLPPPMKAMRRSSSMYPSRARGYRKPGGSLRLARPENSRADPDQRRAFGDGGFQVVGHTHRERIQLQALGVQSIPQFAQPPEGRALRIQILRGGRDGHEAAELQVWQGGDRFREFRGPLRRDPALAGFPGHVHLQADLEGWQARGPLVREAPGDARPVHGVHPLEALRHGTGLVGLQRADEMPIHDTAGESLLFRQGFLQVVLAEIHLARLHGGQDGGGRLGLTHGHQAH